MSPIPHYRKVLREALELRIERNPRYSLRAFASSLELDSSACSQILSGKRVPATAVAKRVMEKLGLDLREQEAFLRSLGQTKLRQGLKRVNPKLRKLASAASPAKAHTRRDLSVDAFRAIARWYYYAILELTKLPDFEDSPKWIARALGIGESEAAFAVDRLLELQMLERAEGVLRKTAGSFYTADPHLTSSAHRRRQKEILEKSVLALETAPIATRNHSAMTVAIDPALIPEAKKRIANFLQELSTFLESNGAKEVYELHLGLFSLHSPSTSERKSSS
ncbi:MAG: TIGR02147 family protein [Bdellovibrionales bacterium]|nr:TIGR02147 family protein [Bdellovibrionales bacterium]